MRFPTPLVPARLIRRYKRFLSDFELEDGREVTAHCANPGALMGLKEVGQRCWLEPNDDPKRKLKYAWRLVDLPGGHMAGIDTSVPNRVVKEALDAGHITELAAYSGIRPEVRYAENSRVDFLLTEPGLPDTFLEVKNCHLRRTGDLAEFPDSVTARGAKHLRDLTAMVAEGHRAVMLYVIQRTDCGRITMAPDLDPAYVAAFAAARAAGVEAIAYDTTISTDGIDLRAPIPVIDPPSPPAG